MYRTNFFSGSNIYNIELSHTNGGNENRNIVFNGHSLSVFNKYYCKSNTVTPLDIIQYYKLIPAFDCFAVKFWKKGNKRYLTYLDDISKSTSYSSHCIIGEVREFDLIINGIKETCIITINKRIYRDDEEKITLYEEIMAKISKQIIDNTIIHIPIILQKEWAIDIDYFDFDHGHIIFDPNTVLKTNKIFYLYHTLELSKRSIELKHVD